jgi:GGDEF domain-containing protein
MLKPAIAPVGFSTTAGGATLRDVVEEVLDVVAQLLNTRLVAISRIEGCTYTVMAVVDQHHSVRAGQIYNVFDTFCMSMLETGHPLRIDDTTQAIQPLRSVPQKLELDVRAYLGVPLYMPDGRVFGSLWAADPRPHHFRENDVALLQLFARLLTPELDQAEQNKRVERIEQARAIHTNVDPTTGLLAGDSFGAILDHEIGRRSRYNSSYAIATLQLDTVDAPSGHGDVVATLRQALADILMRTSRLVDCCARLDENVFAVLFAETTAAGVVAWRSRIDIAVIAWNRVHIATGLELHVQIGIADSSEEPNRATRTSAVLDMAQERMAAVSRALAGQSA